jgi:hypothetical protein
MVHGTIIWTRLEELVRVADEFLGAQGAQPTSNRCSHRFFVRFWSSSLTI